MRLNSKVVIVTGGGAGLGEAISKAYAKEGATVVIADISEDNVKKVENEITQENGKALGVVTDVTKKEDIEQLVSLTLSKYQSIDILVNNAGILDKLLPVNEVTDEFWERVIDINLTAPMRLSREVIKIMIKQGNGNIINMSSLGGLGGGKAGTPYTVSKHGIIGLTKNIGYYHAKQGIRCNAIAPGSVETNLGSNQEVNEYGLERFTSGAGANIRFGKAEEVAAVALFLGSEESSFLNGTVITADAGFTSY